MVEEIETRPASVRRHRLRRWRDPRLADQLLTSAVNFAVPVTAAITLSAREVGVVWITFGVFQCAAAWLRGFAGQPAQLAIGRDATGVAAPSLRPVVPVPLAFAALTAVVAIAIPDAELRRCLLVLAATMPLLLLWDYGRHCAYALERVEIAVRVAGLWAAGLTIGLALVGTVGPSATGLVTAWALSGAVAGAAVTAALRPFTRHSLAATAPLEQRLFLGTDALAGQLAAVAVPTIAGGLVGLTAVGIFQNSRLLFRPMNVLLNLLLVAGIPFVTGAGSAGSTPLERTRRLAVATSAIAAVMAALGLAGYVVVAVSTSVELSVGAIVFAAVEAVIVGPYLVYALLAATMLRAGVLLTLRLIAVAVQVALLLVLSAFGAAGLAAASMVGMLVPAIAVPRWTTSQSVRTNPNAAGAT